MRLKRDGAVGNSACVNGYRETTREIALIQEMATVGWPPHRKHCGCLFPSSINLWLRNMEIRSELYCTLQFLAIKQGAICLRTVRVGIQILVAALVVKELPQISVEHQFCVFPFYTTRCVGHHAEL